MKTTLLTLALALGATALHAQGLALGDVAPDFELVGTDDATHSLATDGGENGTLVVFTCNTCPYAVAYEDRLVALAADLEERGYGMIAIQPNDTDVKPDDGLEAMKERAEDKGFGFAYVIDEGQRVYPQFGATRTPHLFLLDAERRVRYIGALDDNTDADKATRNYVLEAADALAAGEQPDPASTKAIGCSIKVKR